jgi:branched-chain amino acid transport system permease protein
MIISALGVLFDGFAYGMLLFLLSVGLSVTLGMMNFVNLAHCTFAMIGGYVAVTLMNGGDFVPGFHLFTLPALPFFATLPLAFLVAGAVGFALERSLFKRLYRAGDLDQCLLTIGVVFVSIAAMAWFYGTAQQPVSLPNYLRGSFNVAGLTLGVYRIFLIIFALIVTAALIGAIEFTRFGAQIRAAVDNQRMARGLGINVDGAFAIAFALGSGLAGLGGALAIDVVGLDPQFALAYLVYVLIVVAVGGLGSIGGTFAGAILLGISDMAGKYYFPAIGSFMIYLVMISLLMWRPAGIFGRR